MQLQEAAVQSGVLEIDDDFLAQEFRERCELVMPNVTDIKPEDCKEAFIYLKRNF